MKVSKKRTAKRSWRRFSVSDVFGFLVVKELLNIGIDVESCKHFVEDLRKSLYDTLYLIYFFAIGEPIFLVADIEHKKVETVLGHYQFTRFFEFHTTSKPIILVPLHNLLRITIERTSRKDFYLETFRDAYPAKEGISANRVAFWVDGEKIEFSKSDMEKVEKVMSFDMYFDVSEGQG